MLTREGVEKLGAKIFNKLIIHNYHKVVSRTRFCSTFMNSKVELPAHPVLPGKRGESERGKAKRVAK